MIVAPSEWKRRVSLTGCVVHANPSDCEWPLEAHHVIAAHQLKKRGLHHLLYDVRNGLCLCYRAHRRHTNRTEPIDYSYLSQQAIDFATEVGLDWQLDRDYPRGVVRDGPV